MANPKIKSFSELQKEQQNQQNQQPQRSSNSARSTSSTSSGGAKVKSFSELQKETSASEMQQQQRQQAPANPMGNFMMNAAMPSKPVDNKNVKVIEATDQFHHHIGSSSNRLVVAKFSASWCQPCQMIAPTFAAYSVKYPNVIFLAVDVEKNKEISGQYNVRGIPTFLLFRSGRVVDEVQGPNSMLLKKKIRDWQPENDEKREKKLAKKDTKNQGKTDTKNQGKTDAKNQGKTDAKNQGKTDAKNHGKDVKSSNNHRDSTTTTTTSARESSTASHTTGRISHNSNVTGGEYVLGRADDSSHKTSTKHSKSKEKSDKKQKKEKKEKKEKKDKKDKKDKKETKNQKDISTNHGSTSGSVAKVSASPPTFATAQQPYLAYPVDETPQNKHIPQPPAQHTPQHISESTQTTHTNNVNKDFPCNLQIRLLDGSIIRCGFWENDTLRTVKKYIAKTLNSKEYAADAFSLLIPLPRRVFSKEDEHLTVREAGLIPTATLVVTK